MSFLSRRHPPPWTTWVWSAAVWFWVASAIGRSGQSSSGPARAALGLAAGVGDAVLAENAPTAVTPLALRSVEVSAPPEAASVLTDQARILADRKPRWHSLTASLRRRIDAEATAGESWRAIRIGGSGDACGCAADFFLGAASHLKAPSSAGPHFVIGNGSRSPDGAIEVSSSAFGAGTITIALVGELSTAPPTDSQLRALTELVDYLRAKVGVIPIAAESSAALLSREALAAAF